MVFILPFLKNDAELFTKISALFYISSQFFESILTLKTKSKNFYYRIVCVRVRARASTVIKLTIYFYCRKRKNNVADEITIIRIIIIIIFFPCTKTKIKANFVGIPFKSIGNNDFLTLKMRANLEIVPVIRYKYLQCIIIIIIKSGLCR